MNLKLFVVVAVLQTLVASAAETLLLRVDPGRTNGVVRPLHGLNKGPLAAGGMIDLTTRWRELSPPLTRLHDCQWPFPEVVDIHSIFREPDADPESPDSYDWALTDSYLAAIRATGAAMVYRLGESIEHGPVKRFVHPPRDFERWAAVSLGIIRHYNEAWANGTRHNIRYWEIWNEPENRPAMWSGSDDDYIRLYRTAARAIKARFPGLKIGGPALGYSGRFDGGRFVPSGLLTNFLDSCRRDALPLDFFSWHCYTADPAELRARAQAIRRLLDEHGFARTESHLNEWNYLPGNSWDAFARSATPELRRQFYERLSGAEGAAFVATALIELQDAPVDVCNFYHGDLGEFGLFDQYGAPNRVFYALRAFGQLARMECRVATRGGIAGKVAVLAAKGDAGKKVAVLVSSLRAEPAKLEIGFAGLERVSDYRVCVSDARQPWREAAGGRLSPDGRIGIELAKPGFALVELEQ